MKLLIVLQVFAFVLFLFIPSIAVMLYAGFILRSSFWFTALGLPVLVVNGIALFVQPLRSLIALRLTAMGRLK